MILFRPCDDVRLAHRWLAIACVMNLFILGPAITVVGLCCRVLPFLRHKGERSNWETTKSKN
jgi:hypothetical protein